MRIRSIGSKLTLWYTGLLTLTFLLLGTIAYGLLAYSLSRDMDYALKGIGGVMVDKARAEGHALYPSEVDELFRRFFGFLPRDPQFAIVDPRQKFDSKRQAVRSHTAPISPEIIKKAARGESHFETVASSGQYPVRILILPVIESGHLVNLVQVGMSLENMYKTRNRFLLIMAAVFPLGLLLAGGGGWLLARRALSPVDKMTKTARKIGGEHLNQRLHESGNGDELDRLAKTLNDMLGRLHNSIDQMRQFSADASHELQTPLTILKGEMEVALRKQRTPDEYQQVLGSGLEEIDRLNHLVEGLLLLARADSGVLRLDMQSINLKSFVADIIRQLKPMAESHNIDLILETSEAVSVAGDPEHLRRLVLNLLTNAIKYSEANGKVVVTLEVRKQWVVLNVSDTGIGIPEAEQQQIFNRFHRATETGSRDGQGVGLGLSIADSIVKAHKGYIKVESNPNHGTTFSVFLPANLQSN
jgi:two-component system, OmpR family, sensor kinase